MVEQAHLSEKIPDRELRQIAIEGSDEKVSVIIVLDFPAQRFEIAEVTNGITNSYFPTNIKPETPEEKRERRRITTKAKKFLEGVLETPPNWLPMAQAFVATADGKQLRAIADSPVTKVIQPNRTFT